MPPFDFAGTNSLVTGASSGLGAEFARQLAARGSDLVLVARSADRLAALAEELQARHGVTVTALPADLSLADEVSHVVAVIATTGIHVLVNNAGFGTYGAFADLDAGREHAEMMVNAVAAVDLAHAALPGMLARRSGGIITVASSIAFQASPRQAVYGATKAFSLAFSEALWAETRGSGVRIVALCPGPVATGFTAGLGDQAATSSIIYRRTTSPANVVQACLRGFDHNAMTVIPGLRTRFLAQGHRFFPRTIMARMTGRMLAPSPAEHHDRQQARNHTTSP
ncbi:MAG TPA: SDR family oxidoreductase [Streptosporangiaceae bacterium]